MKPPEIRARLKRTGRSQAALARHLNISKDSMSRLINEQRRMEADEAELIRDFFGEDQPQGPTFVQIPVYGFGVTDGDPDRVSLHPGHVLERIEVPAGLTRGEGMAVRVPGDSMEPRLYAGEMVIVDMGVPPNFGGDCLVEMRDGSGLVKQYKGQRDGVVFLWQFNPDKEVRLAASTVKAIHAVRYRR